MSYVLENCPSLQNFCLCLPLKAGLVFISIQGLVYAGAFIFLFTSYGSGYLQDQGLPKAYAKSLRYIHGMFGIQLCAVNILLFIAYVVESDALCEVYIWFAIIFWGLLITSSFVVACGAVYSGSIVFAAVLLAVMSFAVLMSVYNTIVVANYRMTLP